MPLNVVLVGGESAATQVLDRLARGDDRIEAVLAESADGAGAGLARMAERLGIPVLDAKLVTDAGFARWLGERSVDILLNVHSLSIVHGDVTRAPRIGSFNLHPGPLPQYAGMNVVSWAIFRGEASHAVTLHWMTAGIDAGAVAFRADFPITASDTGLTVFSTCVRLGVPLVARLLEAARGDTIPAEPQVGERTLYRRRDRPLDGRLGWSRPAGDVDRLVRACDFGPFPSPVGHPATQLGDRRVEIASTARTGVPCGQPPGTVGEPVDGLATVATSDEWLAVRQAVVDGRRIAGRDLLHPGERLADAPGVVSHGSVA